MKFWWNFFKLLLVIIFTARVTAENEIIEAALKIIGDTERNIKYSENKDVVFVIGNSGTGMTSLIQWLIDDTSELISKSTGEGDFMIARETLRGEKLAPELFMKETTPYFEFPGLSETKNISHDLASSYFINNLVNHVEKVKIVYVADYPSVRIGHDTENFFKMLQRASNFIIDMKKFDGSIALLVTKVENIYMKQANNLVRVSDDQIMSNIANFLKKVKSDLLKSVDVTSSESIQRQIELIDIFLKQKNGKFSRVGLFRKPESAGPIGKMENLQIQRKNVLNIVEDELVFTAKDGDDFGYTLSNVSPLLIREAAMSNSGKFKFLNANVEKVKKIAVKKPVKFHATPTMASFRDDTDPDSMEVQARILLRKMAKEIDNIFNNQIYQMLSTLDAKNMPEKTVAKSFIDKTFKIDNFVKTLQSLLKISQNYKDFIRDLKVAADILNEKSISMIVVELENLNDIKTPLGRFDKIFAYLRPKFQTNREVISKKTDRIFKGNTYYMNIYIESALSFAYDHFSMIIEEFDVYNFPEELRFGVETFSKLLTEIKTNEIPSKLVQKAFDSMKIEAKNLDSIFADLTKLETDLQFLSVLNSDIVPSLTWTPEAENILNYLSENLNWLDFIEGIETKSYEKFRYDIQKFIKGCGKAVTAENFPEFIEIAKNHNVKGENNVRNMKPHGNQLNHLNNFLRQLGNLPQIKAINNIAEVTGDFVNLCEVVEKISSFNSAKIFAFKGFFVDCDLNKDLDLVVIAPYIDIIGNRNIVLKGKDSTNPPRGDNFDGKSGINGGKGGSFLAITLNIENSDKLRVSSEGGNGSDGENGADEKRQYDPFSTSTFPILAESFCKYDNGPYFAAISGRYEVYKQWFKKTNDAQSNRVSGKGGTAGLKGLQGIIQIHTEESQKVVKNLSDGVNGQPGKGGDCTDLKLSYLRATCKQGDIFQELKLSAENLELKKYNTNCPHKGCDGCAGDPGSQQSPTKFDENRLAKEFKLVFSDNKDKIKAEIFDKFQAFLSKFST